LESSSLESGTSEGAASIRKFNTQTMPQVQISTLIIITANNANVRADQLRRTLTVRIVSPVEDPETVRHTFDPYERARNRRPQILAAGFTIFRAWAAELDRRRQAWIRGDRNVEMPSRLGSFEEWSDLVAGAVKWLTGTDLCESIIKAKKDDPVLTAERQLFTALREVFGERKWQVKDVMPYFDENGYGDEPLPGQPTAEDQRKLQQMFREVLPIKKELNSRTIGQWLLKKQDRIHEGLRLIKAGEEKGSARWQLISTD
jgi:putative DNA primase/helicase